MSTLMSELPSFNYECAFRMDTDPFNTGLPGGISNFGGGEIDDGFEEFLRAAPLHHWGKHAAWNFNGNVWFDGVHFCEQVWRYNAPMEVVQANTVKGLMEKVNHKYGWE